MSQEQWAAMGKLRVALNAWCAEVFDRHDLIVTPTVPFDPYPAPGPYPTVTEGRPQAWSNVGSFTIPFNLSWHPAATVRAGSSRSDIVTIWYCRRRGPSSANVHGIRTGR